MVVQTLRNVKRSWPYVCRFGTEEEVLTMLSYLNVAKNEISLVAWRLSSAKFYAQVIELCRSRQLYSTGIWAWSFTHKDVEGMREYLECNPNLERLCGPELCSSFLTIDPKQRNSYQHREYGKNISRITAQL